MEHDSIGQRIAFYRKRRGLPQTVLAGLVGRSPSWLTKIERGELVMDRISVLLELAQVLKVEPGDLIGGVSLPPNGGAPHDPVQGIPAVRRALFPVHLPGHSARASGELRASVEQAGQLACNGFYQAAALVLAELLVDARVAVAQDVPDAPPCLAAAYHVAARFARDVGAGDLTLLTAERAVSAARSLGDPLLTAASARDLAFALLRQGWLDEAGSVCSDAADALAIRAAASVERWALWGSLQLTGAVTAARSGDAAGAWRLLRDARTAAERVGPGRNDYWEAFGPANVGAHEVAVALEFGDVVEALRLADGVEVDELPIPERRAHVLIDMARAQALRRDDAATVLLLLEAERHSPEDVRYSVKARELVRMCLGRERRSRTRGLRGLAERIGAAD